jgi:PAS domain S-box-containing protein
MSFAASNDIDAPEAVSRRITELFKEQQQNILQHTDRLFSWLMILQWFFAVGLALWISPRTWAGVNSQIHPHVWLAICLGGIITSLPVFLGRTQPGKTLTRHVIAVGQMLMSALLIHLTGGRIETHFHVFVSLAILAFYRDWRVLISASAVVFADHIIRGIFWPESVYGVLYASIWRSLEHAGWVLFEVTFLIIAIRKSMSEMFLVAERQAKLEFLKESIEQTVTERTADLTRENLERRQAEERLRKSQSQLAQAHQIAKIGSWEWDVVRDEVSFSEETRSIYGYSSDGEFDMKMCLERVHPEDVARVQQTLAEAIKNQKSYACNHRALLPDGTIHMIQGCGEIITDKHGKVVKIFGVVQDVTEAKTAQEALQRSEEQLRQAQKMEAVGQLAGGVAHDFNNLLTVINGYCAMALQKQKEVEPIRKNIEEIQKAAERAASLTSQLLAFSRKQVLRPQVLQLNEVVQGMEKMLQRLIGEDVELSTTYGSLLGNVKADPGQIEQVIMNLAVNARDAMPRGGKLTISTSNTTIDQKTKFRNRTLEVGEYILVAISDNGVGMTDEVKAHLFEPFFTTKGLGKGTGLGLATCYGIICQSGGEIRVYSEPNSGTTFKIYLPRTDAVPDLVATPDLESLSNGTESILVVEDDLSVRGLAVTILRNCGYQVQESNNAFEALVLLKQNPHFDLVVTDVIMPQMSGKDLYDQIRSQLPQIKVLLMSGYTDDALAHHGVLDENLPFLEKPFSPAKLSGKVRGILDDTATRKIPSRSLRV